MAGLNMTAENTAVDVRALTSELRQLEQKRAAAHPDHHERLESRIEQVREQLRLRGSDAAAPHQRAAKRMGRPPAEVRA